MSGTGRANSPKPSGGKKPAQQPVKRSLWQQVLAIGGPNDWRAWLQRFLVISIVGVLVLVGAFFVAYESTSIPDPNAAYQAQTTEVYYADGKGGLNNKGLIGTYATQDRESVHLNQVAQSMQDAAVAAEDRTFWTNTGVDIKSILRSVFNDAQGGATQGGSTITMQYVKILYLNQSQTITRKIKQIFLALKVQKQETKAQILEGYLNTIYFGRGAYGIQAAAQAYFGVPAIRLTPRQSAMLAAEINQPSYLDPTGTPAQKAALLGRYQYVLNSMVTMGTFDAGRRDKVYDKLPVVMKQNLTDKLGGQIGFVMDMVKKQLLGLGFTKDQIYESGLRVTTTLTDKAMKAAQTAVTANRPSGVSHLHAATASVDVKTGALLAFYAGQDYLKSHTTDPANPASQYNWATAPNPPGSVFKVPALAAALANGWSLKNTFDGNSPLDIGAGQSIGNEADAAGQPSSYGSAVTLLTGLVQSINTVFVDMTLSTKSGAQKIMNMAEAMGVPKDAPGLTYKGSNGKQIPPATISLGSASVSPVDIANTYATVANGGMAHPTYMISKVTDSTGKVLWQHRDQETQAMSSSVADDVSYAMQQVVSQGTGRNALNLGRAAAGKTGTATGLNNQHVITSWFAGFTPQIATAVIYLRTDPKGGGYLPLDGAMPSYFGADYPTRTWTTVMSALLSGVTSESFPPPGNVKATTNVSGHPAYTSPTASPTPKATPTKKATKKPTQQPTQSPTPPPPTDTPTDTPTGPPTSDSTCGTIINRCTPTPSPTP